VVAGLSSRSRLARQAATLASRIHLLLPLFLIISLVPLSSYPLLYFIFTFLFSSNQNPNHNIFKMVYEPLDQTTQEIRLLQILPKQWEGSLGNHPQIHCKILHSPLAQAPNFNALSYCWGDPQDPKLILLDGISVPVTKNLHSALLKLRRNSKVINYWVDAICINQQDNEEKSWQVQMMKDIYRHAQRVTVWLGPSDAQTDAAMIYIKALGDRALSCWLHQNPKFAREQWIKLAVMPVTHRDPGIANGRYLIASARHPITGSEIGRYTLSALNDLYYSISGKHNNDLKFPIRDLERLLTLPFWGRTWVMQEVIVAQHVNFRCGSKLVSFEHFIATLEAFEVLRSIIFATAFMRTVMTPYELSITDATFRAKAVRMLRLRRQFSFEPYPLIYLLQQTCIAEHGQPTFLDATDPRDKVFGLLGLASDKVALEEKGVTPNYRFSCQEIYATTTTALIDLGHANVLSCVQFPKTQVGLPSWVPDWSAPLNPPLQRYTTGGLASPKFSASMGLGPLIRLSYHTEDVVTGLSTSGIIFDTIFDTGKPWDAIMSKPRMRHNSWISEWLEVLDKLTLLHGHECIMVEDERREAIIRTSTADCSATKTSDGLMRMTSERKLASVIAMYNGEDLGVIETLGLGKILRSRGYVCGIDEPALREFQVYEYENDVATRAKGRMPYITKKGYLGLGPKNLRNGDLVALLVGYDVPFVLRNAPNEKFELVGETYVDGIMDGEACGNRHPLTMFSLV
jgi:hypothetical protein